LKTSSHQKASGALTRRGFLTGTGALAAVGVAANVATPRRAHADEVVASNEAKTVQEVDGKKVFDGSQLAMGRVVHNSALCSGCRTCEIVCATYHEGTASSTLSRMLVHKNVMDACTTDIMTCKQCAGPECVIACPTGALSIDPNTGARVIDETQCVGCQICLNACPVEPPRIRFNAEKNVCFKCDLCGGEPQCVKFCPMGALTASWEDTGSAEEEESLFEVVLDGSSKTFTHCELNTLKLEEADGGIALHGVVWTSHATQFNIIMATIQVTADFYVGGELAGTSDDVANINIPEMSSSQFTLNWATSTKMDEITKVIVHVVGENVTNAPTEEVTNG